ncbi:MAG TPA: hypothetical protein VL793_08840 [Patescibacteria group bacterium]|nr:hypothetical protein [Patescibacteria group bacterium]
MNKPPLTALYCRRLLTLGNTLLALVLPFSAPAQPQPRRLNNLTALLLEAAPSRAGETFSFTRPRDGWIFISAGTSGYGEARLVLDGNEQDAILLSNGSGSDHEAMRHVTAGNHVLRAAGGSTATIKKISVKAIPELIYSGLGYNPQIKSFGTYDMAFLQRDVLPNITTMIIPASLKLEDSVINDWHQQGKRFVAETGVNPDARTADEHAAYWTAFLRNAPFLDGIIIDEFIVNRPISEWMPVVSPARQARFDKEKADYELYSQAFKKIRADSQFDRKTIYVYVGGSGIKLNQEIIGTNVLRTLIDCGYFVVPERYVHERSSEEASRQALREFVEGLADWEAKEPGIKKQMIITFALFSMPTLSNNKQPNVDYHVWMDQQVNAVANDLSLHHIAGLNWWTSLLADEETVRFVGKLYRHYAIEGKTNMLSSDPLFLTHIQNPDFEHGTQGWTLHPAEEGAISARHFPRYGRIEGRYMGLISPPDPEHIGDTFLTMKRSEKGPNSFSQTIKNLQPGRLYSFEMYVCDYNDLRSPTPRKPEETKAIASVVIDGAEVDRGRSFAETYASNPEPKTPLCITYYWKVFRAKSTSATLTVSDWPESAQPAPPFGQEQAFNFIEIQPYHE